MHFLYDPRTNILTETTYTYLEKLTGLKGQTLKSYKCMGKKIKNINCYLTDKNVTLKQRRAWYEKEVYQDELWKPIHGSGGKFLVSNYGRFKRVYKNHTNFLLPYLRQKGGYLQIKVMFKDKYKDHKIASIVAFHFIGRPQIGKRVYHKNGIITDDFAGNLEYLSKEEIGRKVGFKSKSKPVVRLDLDTLTVQEEYRSAREAGRENFISYQAVLDNCNHKTKVCCGDFLFMFMDEYEQSSIERG